MFQAPDTDTDPTAGGFKAPDDDLEPKSLAGFGKNVVQDVKGNVQGIEDLAEGLSTHPIQTIENVPGALIGEGKRIGLGELLTGHPINAAEKFANAAYEKPLSTAMDVAPVLGAAGKALGLGGAAAEGAEAAETAAKGAEMAGAAGKAAPAAEATAEAAEAAETGLPVIPPGAKTGPPHALFAYNDKFGPGGTDRSLYNVFGDPEHPAIKERGWGSSVTQEDLDKVGIPITGRQPGSERYTPINTKPPVTEPPPAASGTPPPPPGQKLPLTETLANEAMNQAKEVKDYISRGYEGYAKKPGALADIADYVQEKSQMMAAQQAGFTPNQVRQLGKTPLEGHNAMRAIGQYMLDKEIVSPGTGLGGMLEKNASLTKSVGKTLGDYREMADRLAGDIDPKAVAAEVRKALDSKYMRIVKNAEGEESAPRGAYGGQSGAYLKALQEVEDADKSHSGIADAATELNHAANKAAKNMQPETPFTDVANEVSRINNERIKQLIGPENAAKYEQALREYGVNKKIANALKFKSSGEVKRFGPGSTFSNMTQKLMDEFGYRVGSKAANKLSTSILNTPAKAANLPSLFKEFIHQVEDVGHDVTGMAKGGMVPDDVRQYVSSRC